MKLGRPEEQNERTNENDSGAVYTGYTFTRVGYIDRRRLSVMHKLCVMNV